MKFYTIADDVKLGKDVKIFSFVNLYGCEIGDNTKIGIFVEIQKNAKIGKIGFIKKPKKCSNDQKRVENAKNALFLPKKTKKSRKKAEKRVFGNFFFENGPKQTLTKSYWGASNQK